MTTCCVSFCKSNSQLKEEGISFHMIPKEHAEEWAHALGMDMQIHHSRKLVCSKHFKHEDFNRTLHSVRLREGAIPSVNLSHFPDIKLENTNLYPEFKENIKLKNNFDSCSLSDPLHIPDETDVSTANGVITSMISFAESKENELENTSNFTLRSDALHVPIETNTVCGSTSFITTKRVMLNVEKPFMNSNSKRIKMGLLKEPSTIDSGSNLDTYKTPTERNVVNVPTSFLEQRCSKLISDEVKTTFPSLKLVSSLPDPLELPIGGSFADASTSVRETIVTPSVYPDLIENIKIENFSPIDCDSLLQRPAESDIDSTKLERHIKFISTIHSYCGTPERYKELYMKAKDEKRRVKQELSYAKKEIKRYKVKVSALKKIIDNLQKQYKTLENKNCVKHLKDLTFI